MTSADRLSRRSFLISVAAVGGALVLGFELPDGGEPARAADGAPAAAAAPEINAWILIQPDDTVVIRVARSEMGQGILTALSASPAMIAALISPTEMPAIQSGMYEPEAARSPGGLRQEGRSRPAQGGGALGSYQGRRLRGAFDISTRSKSLCSQRPAFPGYGTSSRPS
jgi:CO/xanthine dehydrogenase Mo-binding subunit